MMDPSLLNRLLSAIPCGISIYMPVDPAERDLREHEARLRRLIQTAETELERSSLERPERENLIDALNNFLAGADFARHRAPGLALFVAPPTVVDVTLQYVPLPSSPTEIVVVGPDFHIKPLLPLVAEHQRFGILALSKGNVRLLTATPFIWQDVPLETLPADAQAELDARLEAAPSDQIAEQVRRELLVASTRNTATAVKAAVSDDPAPIILAADPHVAGPFLQQAEIRQILPEPLHLNPFALSDQDLHAKALDVIRPALEADCNAVLEQITARLGSNEPTVAVQLEQILTAGREGRIDSVVVALDEVLWGHLLPEGGLVPHGTPGPDDEDLLNLAALLALRHGGRAFALPRQRIPRQTPAAATFRF